MPAVHATYTKPGKTIRNLEDFYRHTTLHKKRVVALGLYLYDKRPDLFEGLDRELLKKALLSHDNAKVLPEFTDKKGRTFYRALYEDGLGRKIAIQENTLRVKKNPKWLRRFSANALTSSITFW